MSNRPAAQPKLNLATHLAQWSLVLWITFLLWSALALYILPNHIGDLAIQRWLSTPGPGTASPLVEMPLDGGPIVAPSLTSKTAHLTGPGTALQWLLQQFDLIWVLLAFACIYLYSVRTEGLATTRRWFAILLGGTLLLTAVGGGTGFPFGPLSYSHRLGWKLASIVPFAVPLFWTVILLSSTYTILYLFPRSRQWQPHWLALGSALLTVLTDLNLERIAWQHRFYWRWQLGGETPAFLPPLQNFLAWGAAAFLLTFFLRGGRVAPTLSIHPVLILGAFNLVFLAVHLFA